MRMSLCLSFFLAPIWRSNRFAGPFITAGSNQQGSRLEFTRIMEEISSSSSFTEFLSP